jgi:hypothetical protein
VCEVGSTEEGECVRSGNLLAVAIIGPILFCVLPLSCGWCIKGLDDNGPRCCYFCTGSIFAAVLITGFVFIVRAGGPIICSPGTYTSGLASCGACPAGTFSSYPDAPECEPCPLGHAATGTGSSICMVCPAGTYANAIGKHTLSPFIAKLNFLSIC